MQPRSAASAYRESTFESAPPIKLVHMLYEGALRFIDQAERLDIEEEAARYTELVGRASSIVGELRLSLEHQPSPELAAQLEGLYLFCESELREALLMREKKHLAGAREVLVTLLDAWKTLALELGDEAA